MSFQFVSDEEIVRQQNYAVRQLTRPSEQTVYDRLIREAQERHQRSLAEARERLRARGVDPDSL